MHDRCAAASRHVARARLSLDRPDDDAVALACAELDAAVAALSTPQPDDPLARSFRDPVEQWRAALASYALAARDLEAAGVHRSTVRRLLLRATNERVRPVPTLS